MTLKPDISRPEADAIVETKTAPKCTVASIEARIADVSWFWKGTFCICFITMKNGFVVVGKAAAASPENTDRFVGERYAYDDAFKQLWPMEAYLLREKLSQQ